ncbi:MAG: hypothetical protein RSF88_12225 [Lachnospiraceae bacterium]
MAAKVNMLKKYEKADASKRVDIICNSYPVFIGIIDSYTEGLKYMIQNEKEYNRKSQLGDLGIRVQTSGLCSDKTGDAAIEKVMMEEAIKACDFSGDILKGTDQGEEFERDAAILRTMRNDYALFNKQLGILKTDESRVFMQYLNGEMAIAEIADKEGIQYESVQQKVLRVKRKIKIQMVAFIDGTF